MRAIASDLLRRADTLICHNIGHIFDNYAQRKGHCHENVRLWMEINRGDRRIFGWLIDRSEETHSGRMKLIAHSIALTTAGEHFDVTMACDDGSYPFVIAEMAEADFDVIAAKHPEFWFVADEQQFMTFLRAQNESLAALW
jgi:hypothetical protein